MQQDTTKAARVRFGSLGWDQTPWAGDYYPEDLPPDWRLTYYANHLLAVLVPAVDWRGLTPDELRGWAAEVHAGFRFYLMADAAQPPEPQFAAAAVLGDRLGGVLWPDAAPPRGCLGPMVDLPGDARGWGDARGLCVALLPVAGLDLRARRARLEALAPWLGRDHDIALILDDPAASPEQVRELQTVAELLALA